MNAVSNNPIQDATSQIIKQIIDTWLGRNEVVTNFFKKYDDAAYAKEVAPNRNRAVYLLGHLIAVNDGMLPLFGLGDRLYPQLEAIFITSPDKTVTEIPTLAELKGYWEQLNTTLTDNFNKMTVEEWLDRHTSVSPEDFALNPSRNKLNVLLSRTNHESYHFGQLNFLTV